MRVIWSNHAVERAIERIGGRRDILIPNRKICEEARQRRVGESFRVRRVGVIYACVREAPEVVVIATVFDRSRRRRKSRTRERWAG